MSYTPSILFFLIMIMYIIFVDRIPTRELFIIKIITACILTFCIQYLYLNNYTIIAWLLVYIPLMYILSIYIMRYLLNE
jgi:hypothetical protein